MRVYKRDKRKGEREREKRKEREREEKREREREKERKRERKRERNIFQIYRRHQSPKSVLFYFSFVCLHVCANAFKFKVHCGSAFEPGASGLPSYCTPTVCVPTGGLIVWLHNNKKRKRVFPQGSRKKNFAGYFLEKIFHWGPY